MAKTPKDAASPVAQLHREILISMCQTALPCPDAEMNRRAEAVSEATVQITQLPAASSTDVVLKAAILCQRLRQQVSIEHHGEIVDYLLAESIRADLEILQAVTESAAGQGG